MHLKFEGNWVYIMIVPAMILATIIVLALCPDMVLKSETEENPGEDTAYVLPAGRIEPACCSRRGRHRDRPRRVRNEREQVLPTRYSDRSRHGLDFRDRLLGRGQPSTGVFDSRGPRSRARRVAAGRFPASRSDRAAPSRRPILTIGSGSPRSYSRDVRCRAPASRRVMKGLQERLARTNVLLVSISVDPEHDTPAVLTEYADRFGASPDRWWFLTGPKESTYDLVHNRLQAGAGGNDGRRPRRRGRIVLTQ